MRAWSKSLSSLLAIGAVLVAFTVGPSAAAADPAQPAKVQAPAQPSTDGKQPAAAGHANATAIDTPSRTEEFGAMAGGILLIALAAIGLTITFRSLAHEIRGRRNRYRRRVRREPRSSET